VSATDADRADRLETVPDGPRGDAVADEEVRP
jgi:hypothetical protein